RQGARHLDGIHVDDQRAGARPALDGEDARHGLGIERVSAQAVHGLGGERYQASSQDQLGGAGDFRPHSGVSSLSSPAILPVLRHTRYAWMSASRSPSRTRSTSPMERRLRRTFTMREGGSTWFGTWLPKLISSLESSVARVSTRFLSSSNS